MHAAIKALNFSKRISLISIDNRSRELCKDLGINVLERNEIRNINSFIHRKDDFNISVPYKSIEEWRNYYIKEQIL